MNQPLAKLERADVHKIWAKEASDFTPWLAEADNLSLLGEVIGVELELEAQEKNVGPFRADILCKDTVTDQWVLIENQLERTDHTHLGQLMTYAAGPKAVTIVWIADRFTDEHRAALDWLNEITDERFNFFGLEIELWRIGDSPYAPKFNAVCKPNDWTKPPPPGPGKMTDTKLLQREYWSGLRQILIEAKSPVKPHKAHPQHWTNFAIGRAYFHMIAMVNTRENCIAVGLVMVGPEAKHHFHRLHSMQSGIERELDAEMDWLELPSKKESRIELRLSGADIRKREDWSRQHAWLKKNLEELNRVFRPRVKSLDADEWQPDDEEVEV